jgi:hypothetical protein
VRDGQRRRDTTTPIDLTSNELDDDESVRSELDEDLPGQGENPLHQGEDLLDQGENPLNQGENPVDPPNQARHQLESAEIRDAPSETNQVSNTN